ncbi:MAG: LON peptidase substrate-binding domain-containing protein [Acidobacteria bacterium]|nr:LON peptidase substrate-binding domain-containing protein [Acidobacteriota bacterium]
MPLFPLNVVLFPQTDLPLHIFEERYKQMIKECVEARREFGVILAQDNSVQSMGCAAAITSVVKRYDDGRMDIITRGTRRFEILMLDREMPYLRGEPQFFNDEPSATPLDDSSRMKAMQLFAELQELLGIEQNPAGGDKPELGHPQLSYQLMSRLPGDLEFKQSLLQLRSEDERLARVTLFLDTLKTQLRRTIKARATASGNGKGR